MNRLNVAAVQYAVGNDTHYLKYDVLADRTFRWLFPFSPSLPHLSAYDAIPLILAPLKVAVFMSVRRHYPVQVVRVFLSFASKATPDDCGIVGRKTVAVNLKGDGDIPRVA